MFGKGKVEVESPAFPFSFFVLEPREIGVGEPGVPVEGDGEDVAPPVEDILLPVAVVVVDVEHGHPAEGREYSAAAAALFR